jgi:hypothetical protein
MAAPGVVDAVSLTRAASAMAASHESASTASAVMWGGVAVNGTGFLLSNEALSLGGLLVAAVAAAWGGYHRRKEYLLRRQVLEAQLASARRFEAAIGGAGSAASEGQSQRVMEAMRHLDATMGSVMDDQGADD